MADAEAEGDVAFAPTGKLGEEVHYTHTSNARFGFAGSIADEATCKAAGGYWIPLALGWMTRIYPNETERAKIWVGEQMMTLNTAEVEHTAHKQQKP